MFHLCLRTYVDKSVSLMKIHYFIRNRLCWPFSHLRDIVSKFASLFLRFLRIGGTMKPMYQSLHLVAVDQPLPYVQRPISLRNEINLIFT